MFELAEKARSFGVPVRIGVNAGSLDREIALKYGGATPEALAGSASNYAAALDKAGFKDVVVSIKASDVYTTICANRLFAEKNDNPLHLGVTEAGTPGQGVIKNAIGIGTLLAEGIGDTVRVSLTAPPEEEIKAARSILQSLGLRVFGPEIISCPTCGRCEIDLIALAEKVEAMLNDYTMPVRVAVMGCAVNGPGEAREADLGIAAGKKEGILFKKGKVVKTVSEDKVLDTIREELALFKRENDHVS
jgi:(E)-4-hydroxy-3-methylbut-2-enyl-diphosphate synthase